MWCTEIHFGGNLNEMGKKKQQQQNFAYYPYLFLNFLSIVSIWIFCPLSAEIQEPKLHTKICYSLPQKTQLSAWNASVI